MDAVVARTSASSRTGEESFAGTAITNLTVLGQAVAPSPDLRVPLGDWGHLTLLQERSQSAEGRTVRGWVTVVDVRLDADHAALPVGTRILVGYAEASASSPKPAPVVKAAVAGKETPVVVERPVVTQPVPPGSRRGLGIPADMPRPGTTGPSPLVQIAPKVTKRLTAAGYVFPVYGPSGFGDTFGAARANDGLASRRGHLRRARSAAAGGRRRNGVLRRVEPRRGQPAVAPRPVRQRVLLRPPRGVLAARGRRRAGAGRRRDRFHGQHGRRRDDAVPPALRDPPVVAALPRLRRRRQRVPVPSRLAAREGRRLPVGGRLGAHPQGYRARACRRRDPPPVERHLRRERARPRLARAGDRPGRWRPGRRARATEAASTR